MVSANGYPRRSLYDGRNQNGCREICYSYSHCSWVSLFLSSWPFNSLSAVCSYSYQVRFKVLQAGHYGAPQGRKRVIFWGARRGIPLPNFPLPTHCFPGGQNNYALPIGGFLTPVTRSKNPDDIHQCAPMYPTTVNHTLGDLPPFDWINPHLIIGANKQDKAEAASRARDLKVLQCDAVPSQRSIDEPYPGFPKPVKYATDPQTRYQKWLRDGTDGKVQGHYTKRFHANLVER